MQLRVLLCLIVRCAVVSKIECSKSKHLTTLNSISIPLTLTMMPELLTSRFLIFGWWHTRLYFFTMPCRYDNMTNIHSLWWSQAATVFANDLNGLMLVQFTVVVAFARSFEVHSRELEIDPWSFEQTVSCLCIGFQHRRLRVPSCRRETQLPLPYCEMRVAYRRGRRGCWCAAFCTAAQIVKISRPTAFWVTS